MTEAKKKLIEKLNEGGLSPDGAIIIHLAAIVEQLEILISVVQDEKKTQQQQHKKK